MDMDLPYQKMKMTLLRRLPKRGKGKGFFTKHFEKLF
jgi:hypothetical protein